tara:strand:+ start:1919 stop:2569 length:651 start_codon:yes stop_codon:yes gene_type:complete
MLGPKLTPEKGKSMKILSHEQGTDDWLASRLGRPSASQFSRLITTSGKPSGSASKYIDQMVIERLSGKSEPIFVSHHMERGTELEPEAKSYYEMLTGYDVTEVGFILDDSEEFGCSPDGLVMVDGKIVSGLEIKCPADNTMLSYIEDPMKGVKKYWQQIQGCMMVTGSETWDFLAYHPEMEHVLVTVEHDHEFTGQLYEEIVKAVNIINQECEELA